MLVYFEASFRLIGTSCFYLLSAELTGSHLHTQCTLCFPKRPLPRDFGWDTLFPCLDIANPFPWSLPTLGPQLQQYNWSLLYQ